jgi:hypothetical protein
LLLISPSLPPRKKRTFFFLSSRDFFSKDPFSWAAFSVRLAAAQEVGSLYITGDDNDTEEKIFEKIPCQTEKTCVDLII